MSAKDHEEIDKLKVFMNNKLENNSYLYQKLNNLLNEINVELQNNNNNCKNNGDIVVSVAINNRLYPNKKTLTIQAHSTLMELKNNIELLCDNNIIVKRIACQRTGRAWTQFSNKTIIECEIISNDNVIIDCEISPTISTNTTNTSINNMSGISRLLPASVMPSSRLALLALGIHCLFLDEMFVAVAEQPNSVPGFAPSIKEVPKEMLVPSNWNQEDPTSVSFLYKHKERPGKQFNLTCLLTDDHDCTVALTQKGGETYNIDIKITDYISNINFPFCDDYRNALVESFKDTEGLRSQLKTCLVNRAIPSLASKLKEETKAASVNTSVSNNTSQPQIPYSAPRNEPPFSSRHPVGVPSVGRGDLDPFPTVPGLNAPSPLGPLPGSGNLVGPNHAIFDPSYYDDGYEGSGGLFGPPGNLPQPRFDPFGPVAGPNSDVDFGNVGVDSRGRPIPMGGRGRGGRSGRGPSYPGQFPGEPNPDHFKPPGW